MDIVADAIRYWTLVEESLVSFYGFDREAAHARVLSLRGRMIVGAIRQDVTYHHHPLHVASDIAKVIEPMPMSMMHDFDAMEARMVREGSVEPMRPIELEKRRKPSSDTASWKSVAVAVAR